MKEKHKRALAGILGGLCGFGCVNLVLYLIYGWVDIVQLMLALSVLGLGAVITFTILGVYFSKENNVMEVEKE